MFHTEQENIICYKSMKEMERELCDKNFVRCHTSYIVNLFYVKGIKKLDIELISGEIIPISQPKRKESLWNVWLTIGEICYDVGISDFRYNFNGNRGYFSVSVLFMVM